MKAIYLLAAIAVLNSVGGDEPVSGQTCYELASRYFDITSTTAKLEDDKCLAEKYFGQTLADTKLREDIIPLKAELELVRSAINCSYMEDPMDEMKCYIKSGHKNSMVLKLLSFEAKEVQNKFEIVTVYYNRSLYNCQNNVSSKLTVANQEIENIINDCLWTGVSRTPNNAYIRDSPTDGIVYTTTTR